MPKKLDIQEAPDEVWPFCPHCKKELNFIWVKSKGIGFSLGLDGLRNV
jgi:hypothetical protein